MINEIKNTLYKNSDLYMISYRRYLSNLIRVCINKEYRTNKDYMQYVIKSKDTLKKELKYDNKNLMGIKLRYMIYGVVYLPLLFNIIDEIYGIISRNKYKYEVR